MKRFVLAALMVCGVVFCGYAQSEISIDSTNIQHSKGKNRWIIGAELPVFSIASGGKAGLATVTFIYGKQKTERFFLGYGISPSLHFDWRKTANTRVTLAISAVGIVPDLYAGIGVNYHF